VEGRLLALVLALAWPYCHPEPSEGSCPVEQIPRCARDDGPDWSRLAMDIHTETNLIRRDPASYAKHLEAMLPRFEGRMLERPGRPTLRTEEGAAAVREAIAALRAQQPLPQLRWSKGLVGAAADHVKDQGPIGGLEHRGTDGSNPARRAERRGRWVTAMAENIAFGDNPARQVVIQLLVDDGVPDRGHRDNILDGRWGAEGAACGPHRGLSADLCDGLRGEIRGEMRRREGER
jgi:uncharacterized protein YkwD